MLALRYAAVVALALWVGGLVALGALAAPAAFDVLGPHGSEGRALAGAVFGETFDRFHTVVYACAAVLLASLVSRAVLGPRPRRFSLRMTVSAVMLAAAAWTGVVLIPQIEGAQQARAAAGRPHTPEERAEFGRLHGLSTSLQLLPLLGGLVLLFFELKD